MERLRSLQVGNLTALVRSLVLVLVDIDFVCVHVSE